MDKITISFTVEELGVLVEAIGRVNAPQGRRRAAAFYRVRGDLQMALATAKEDEEDGEG